MARSIAVLVSGILALIHKVLASNGRQKAKKKEKKTPERRGITKNLSM